MEARWLKETLPKKGMPAITSLDCEKGALLGREISLEDSDSTGVVIVDRSELSSAHDTMGILDLLRAPSVIVLLVSYCILSLHSATFEVVLPHLGHTPHTHSGMSLPCDWMSSISFGTKVLAAICVYHGIPQWLKTASTLKAYQRISLSFPIIYILLPLSAFLATVCDIPKIYGTIVTVLSLFVKQSLAGSAQLLLVLLLFAMAPNAETTGTTVGMISMAELFKSFAVGVSGLSYYLSDDYSTVVVNGLLWAVLAVMAVTALLINRWLRETPLVGRDYPVDCLAWQNVFDADSDAESIDLA